MKPIKAKDKMLKKARKLTRRVRLVKGSKSIFTVPSQSGGEPYEVIVVGLQFSCACRAYIYNQLCAHALAVCLRLYGEKGVERLLDKLEKEAALAPAKPAQART